MCNENIPLVLSPKYPYTLMVADNGEGSFKTVSRINALSAHVH